MATRADVAIVAIRRLTGTFSGAGVAAPGAAADGPAEDGTAPIGSTGIGESVVGVSAVGVSAAGAAAAGAGVTGGAVTGGAVTGGTVTGGTVAGAGAAARATCGQRSDAVGWRGGTWLAPGGPPGGGGLAWDPLCQVRARITCVVSSGLPAGLEPLVSRSSN